MTNFSVYALFGFYLICQIHCSVRHSSFVETLTGNSTVRDDLGYSVIQTSDEGFITSGHIHRHHEGSEEAYIAKYDSDGFLKWVKTLHASNPTLWKLRGYAILQTDDDGYVVTGYTSEIGIGKNLLLARYTSLGNLTWVKIMKSKTNESFDEIGYSIVSSGSDFVICGEQITTNSRELLLSKFSSDGELLWAKTIGGSTYELGRSIQSTSDGNFIVCGATRMGALMPDQSIEILVSKIKADGTMDWARSFGVSDYRDQCEDIIETKDNDFIVTGEHFWDSSSEFSTDLIIVMLNSNGGLVWAKSLGTVGTNSGRSVVETSDGGFVVTGETQQGNDTGIYPFLGKFWKNGSLAWGRFLDNDNLGGEGESVVETNDGKLVVCGHLNDVLGKDILLTMVNDRGIGCDWNTHWNTSLVSDIIARLSFSYCTSLAVVTDVTLQMNVSSPSVIFQEGFVDPRAGHDFLCQSCQAHYFGTACDVTTCFGIYSNETQSTLCSNHGNCLVHDKCTCTSEFYYGDNCEKLYKCFGIPANQTLTTCSGHGKCQKNDFCACEENYFGRACNITTCGEVFSNHTNDVCSSHGKCTAHNRCECYENYFGKNSLCDVTICDGVLSNSSLTCNSGGYCIKPNVCQCKPDVFGKKCDVYTCFGVLSNDSAKVCNTHGECIAPGDCKCKGGYFHPHLGTGPNSCTDFSCFGDWTGTAQACSGHGSCDAPEKCVCETSTGYYFGVKCDKFDCFGFQRNASGVCGGHGSCELANQCKCKPGYYNSSKNDKVNTICDTWSCNSIGHEKSESCASGTCAEPDVCICPQNRVGKFCESCSEGFEGGECTKIPEKDESSNSLTYVYIGVGCVGVIGVGICVLLLLCILCFVVICVFLMLTGCASSICSLPSMSLIGFGKQKDEKKKKKEQKWKYKLEKKRFKRLKEIKVEVLDEVLYDENGHPYRKLK